MKQRADVDVWNPLPGAVVQSHIVSTFTRRLAIVICVDLFAIHSCFYYCICFIIHCESKKLQFYNNFVKTNCGLIMFGAHITYLNKFETKQHQAHIFMGIMSAEIQHT